MATIESGKTVSLNYTGKFEDGHVFDSSLQEGRAPLNTVLGNGNLIPGFEKGLVGLKEGDKKTIEIPPTEGYGEYLDGLVTTVAGSAVPERAVAKLPAWSARQRCSRYLWTANGAHGRYARDRRNHRQCHRLYRHPT